MYCFDKVGIKSRRGATCMLPYFYVDPSKLSYLATILSLCIFLVQLIICSYLHASYSFSLKVHTSRCVYKCLSAVIDQVKPVIGH